MSDVRSRWPLASQWLIEKWGMNEGEFTAPNLDLDFWKESECVYQLRFTQESVRLTQIAFRGDGVELAEVFNAAGQCRGLVLSSHDSVSEFHDDSEVVAWLRSKRTELEGLQLGGRILYLTRYRVGVLRDLGMLRYGSDGLQLGRVSWGIDDSNGVKNIKRAGCSSR